MAVGESTYVRVEVSSKLLCNVEFTDFITLRDLLQELNCSEDGRPVGTRTPDLADQVGPL